MELKKMFMLFRREEELVLIPKPREASSISQTLIDLENQKRNLSISLLKESRKL